MAFALSSFGMHVTRIKFAGLEPALSEPAGIEQAVISDLEEHRRQLQAVDRELSCLCSAVTRQDLRTRKARLLAEIDEIEVALRFGRPGYH